MPFSFYAYNMGGFVHWVLKCMLERGEEHKSDFSYQAEALVMVNSLGESDPEVLFAAVLGQVQQVVAGVSHGQVVLATRRGLDDEMQA
ncbi:hypothetical protein FKM82_024197 [Ascaphus truei]